MTAEELELLTNLFEKHELSFATIIDLLGIGSIRAAIFANESGNEKLEKVMFDLNLDCMAMAIREGGVTSK